MPTSLRELFRLFYLLFFLKKSIRRVNVLNLNPMSCPLFWLNLFFRQKQHWKSIEKQHALLNVMSMRITTSDVVSCLIWIFIEKIECAKHQIQFYFIAKATIYCEQAKPSQASNSNIKSWCRCAHKHIYTHTHTHEQ